MTKNFFFASAVAVSMMALASCSSEDVMPAGGENTVTFTAQLPETVASRAFSDGVGATQLSYAVYDGDKLVMTQANGPAYTYNAADKTFTITFQLAKGKTYDFAFWADDEDSPYEFTAADNHVVTVDMNYDTNNTANNEARDAFFNVEKGVEVNGAIQKTIELRRPFGRLAVGTSDYTEWKAAVAEGTDLGDIAVNVKEVYNTLDLFSGVASDPSEVTFTGVKPTIETEFTVEGDTKTYMYLAMDYILTGTQIEGADTGKPVVNKAQQETKDVNITINDNADNQLCSIPVSAVPFQRNYKTNIYGALLTAPLEYVIIVVPDFYEPDKNVPVVEVSTATELRNALRTPNANILLAKDIEITTGSLNFTKNATIDLGGHTIQTKGGTYGDAFMIQNANVVIKNGYIPQATDTKPNCAVFFMLKNSNLTLDNVKIDGTAATPIYVNGDNVKVDIVSAEIKTNTSQAVYIQKGEGSKVTIEGGRFEASWEQNPGVFVSTYTLNLLDTILTDGKVPTDFIEVKGGTFVNYDPAHSKSENPEVSFVAAGYKSVDNGDGSYTVVKE